MGGRGQLTHLGLPGCAGTQRVPSEDASATPARLLSPHPGSCAPQAPVPPQDLSPHRLLSPTGSCPPTGLTHIPWEAFLWEGCTRNVFAEIPPPYRARGCVCMKGECPLTSAERLFFQEQHQPLLPLFGLAHRTRKEQKMLALKRSPLRSM